MNEDGKMRAVISCIQRQLDNAIGYYERASKQARRAFLVRIGLIGWLLGTGAVLFAVAGLHGDDAIITLFRLQADVAEYLRSMGLAGAVLAAIGGLVLQDTRQRGHRRGWIRYSVARVELQMLRERVALIEAREGDATPPAEEVQAELRQIFDMAQSVVLAETRQWAKDTDADFGDLLEEWAQREALRTGQARKMAEPGK